MSDPLDQVRFRRPIRDQRPFTVVTADGIPWTVTGRLAAKFRAQVQHD